MILDLLKYIPTLIITVILIYAFFTIVVNPILNIQGFDPVKFNNKFKTEVIPAIERVCGGESDVETVFFKVDFSKADIGFEFDTKKSNLEEDKVYIKKIIVYSCPYYDFSLSLQDVCKKKGNDKICFKESGVVVGYPYCDGERKSGDLYIRNLEHCNIIGEYDLNNFCLGKNIRLDIKYDRIVAIASVPDPYQTDQIPTTYKEVVEVCEDKPPIFRTLGSFLYKMVKLSSNEIIKRRLDSLEYDYIYLIIEKGENGVVLEFHINAAGNT